MSYAKHFKTEHDAYPKNFKTEHNTSFLGAWFYSGLVIACVVGAGLSCGIVPAVIAPMAAALGTNLAAIFSGIAGGFVLATAHSLFSTFTDCCCSTDQNEEAENYPYA